jgi:quercetin dioxygenase-like cupin family protein
MRCLRIASLTVLGLILANPAHTQESRAGEAAAAMPLLAKVLQDFPGKEALMLTVEYPPGGTSTAHRHNAETFVYVLQGAVVMAVNDDQEVTVREGETFYESPNDIHRVARNASATQPAKLLVFLLKDQGAPVSLPEK